MEKRFKVSEIEISYRPAFKLSEKSKMASSHLTYQILEQNWDQNKLELLEEFKVILLNRQNRVLGVLNVRREDYQR